MTTTTSVSCAYETIPFFTLLSGSRRELEGGEKRCFGMSKQTSGDFSPKKNLVWDTVHVFISDAMTTLLQQFPVTVILFLHQNSSKFLLLNQILLTWAYLFDFIFQVKGSCLSLRRHKEKLQTLLVPPFGVLIQPGFIVIIYYISTQIMHY